MRRLILSFAIFSPCVLGAQTVVTPKSATPAQQAAAVVAARPISNAELADALRKSGMTQPELRARLQAGGYDPALADPFFAEGPGSQTHSDITSPEPATFGGDGNAASAAIGAFEALGLLGRVRTSESAGVPEATPSRGSDSRVLPAASASTGVFGKDVFNNAATAFDPVAAGPVDASYRLGAGDQLQFILTGDVEMAYQLEVRRDGTVLIPQIGQVPVAGHTIEAARAALRLRAGRAYSGIHTGSTRLDVSVHRIRSNALFVIGEVERPGAIVASALSTSFHALARAGGPATRGSFRKIEVRRGGQVVRRLDLYRYLLTGDASADLRTEHGDVIYVPLADRTVRVAGAVRRPGTFELLSGEGFTDLLGFVGGVLPSASLDRIQIDRILPPEQRSPGVERALIDVTVRGSLDSLSQVKLHDGDVVTVFFVGELRRNTVGIKGEVLQPGTYELTAGLTLGDLLTRAQGLLPWAAADRVKIFRPVPHSGKREEISLDLDAAEARAFALREFDEVMVLDRRVPGGSIAVEGAVWRPSRFAHAEGQSLADVIDAAGGLRPEAAQIVLSRKRTGAAYSDTTSQVFRFDVDGSGSWETAAARFGTRYEDHVYVLASPGVRPQKFVAVSGLFAYPGTYALNEGVDRIADIVARAGRPLPGAFSGNFLVLRKGLPMPVDLDRALRGDARHNVPLMGGDSIFIGPNPGTVKVTGAVARTVLVLHKRNFGIDDYVRLAGGALENADLARTRVEELTGGVSRSRRWLMFRTEPDIPPGSTIVVPERAKQPATLKDVVNSTLQYASVLASLAVAYVAVSR